MSFRHVKRDSDGEVIDVDNAIAEAYDKESKSFSSLTDEHNQIHKGNHYFISAFATLGTDASADIVFEVPSDSELHMTFEVFGQSRTEVLVFEGSDVNSDGTSLTAQNNKRSSSNTSVATIQIDPTVNSDGTNISADSKGKESGEVEAAPTAGPHERGSEIILKPSTTYILRIISRDSDNIVNYKGEWYEVS